MPDPRPHLRLRPRRALLGAALVAVISLVGCGSSSGSGSGSDGATATTAAPTTARDASSSTTVPGSTEVVKDVLGSEVDPPGAPGRTLTLIRYTIPPGAKLAPHIHPGVQMARITSGELTYTVEQGTAIVRRKGASSDERVDAPATITLGPGDTVVERDGMVHFGANETDEPIVIDATLLTVDGEDLAVPVTTTTTP
jgi:quercetin dioxygenase-like cupin family protein